MSKSAQAAFGRNSFSSGGKLSALSFFNRFSISFMSLSASAPGGRKSTPPDSAPASPRGKNAHVFKLRLEFSKAADYGRVTALFDPALKSKIDPKNYVVRREDAALRESIDRGGCAFLSDGQSAEVQTMAIAYNVFKPGNAGPQPDYTEMGSTLSRTAGYNSAQMIVAALALREWWKNAPKNMIITEIHPTNIASLKTYNHYLGWRPVTNRAKADELFVLCNQNIKPEDQSNDAVWLHCDDSVITHQARILLSFMDQGGLIHKQTRKHLDIDFSALNAEGLTRKRLESIALGNTNRAKLAALPN